MDIRLIPGSKGFSASSCGKIFDPKGKERKQYKNGCGYSTSSIIAENGKWQTFGVHRLVALAHITPIGNIADLVVNHKDHDITNNASINLEWTTDKLNAIHSALFKGCESNPSIVARSPEGKHEFIANIQTVSKRFGLDVGYVWELIRDSSIHEGWLFIHNSVRSKKPIDLHGSNKNAHRTNGVLTARKIDIKDIESQDVITFGSLNQAGKHFGVSSRQVLDLMSRNGKVRLFKSKYLIVNHGEDFPILTQSVYDRAISPSGKIVLAYNVSDKKKYVYESAAEFIRMNGLSKKAVTSSLKKNRFRMVRDWWFLYNSKENIERMKLVMECPDS